MVARKNAQASGIDRQRAMKTKLKRKIGNGFINQLRVSLVEPTMIELHRLVKHDHHLVIASDEGGIFGHSL